MFSGCGSVILISLIIVIVLVIFIKNDTEIPSENIKEIRKELDYTKPIFTTHKAIVCPAYLLHDPKTDIQKILGLWTTIFGRSDAVKEAGCEEWASGTKVDIPVKRSEQIISFSSPYNRLEYFTQAFELTNSSKGDREYIEPTKSALSVEEKTNQIINKDNQMLAQSQLMSVDVKTLIDKEETLNDKCRGGSGDDPETISACDERDHIFKEIEKKGWYWGPDDAIEADKHWVTKSH